MKIWKRILLILAVTLLTGMGTVAAWQRNTLEALKYAATMDQEKILTEIQENEQTLERVMKEYALHGENLTAEDIQKLQSGQMTEEEAIEKLLAPVGEAQAQTETTETPQAQASSSAKENADVDAAVQRQIARLCPEGAVSWADRGRGCRGESTVSGTSRRAAHGFSQTEPDQQRHQPDCGTRRAMRWPGCGGGVGTAFHPVRRGPEHQPGRSGAVCIQSREKLEKSILCQPDRIKHRHFFK